MPNNRISHFEIPAHEPEELTRFYSELFGWKFRRAPEAVSNTGRVKPARMVRG